MRYEPDPCIAHIADWLSHQGRGLHADFSQAASFLQALDPVAREFSFRTFSDSPYTRRPGFDPLQRAIHGSLTACWDELIDQNRRGAVICVTINRTNGKGRAVSDIEQVRALFLDDDNPTEKINRFPLVPQIQVQTSPGHYHHYWLVKGLDHAGFTSMQRQLAGRYGGDHRVLALNQAMQLPGLWRRKRLTQPRHPSLETINRIPAYTLSELMQLIAI